MMDSLFTAQTGLRISRLSIDATSNNIANKDTEGYKKRVVETSELSPLENDIGNGVRFDGVKRITNDYLLSRILTQNSYSNYYEQQDSTLSNVEIIFKESGNSGFSNDLSEFLSSIESLRSDPTSSIYDNEAETEATTLVNNLKSLYDDIEELQNDNLSLFKDQVDKVNSILEDIVYLNQKMKQSNDSNALLDKRDQLEKELSNYVDVDVDTRDDVYSLSIGGERVIFNTTNSSEIIVNEEYIAQQDVYTTTDLNDSSITNGDTITVTINNGATLTITANTTSTLGDFDVKQQIVNAINTSADFTDVQASLDSSNNLVLTAKNGGEDNPFDIKIDIAGTNVSINEGSSTKATDNVYLSAYGEPLELTGGSLKSLKENLTTETSKISSYKQSLNDFAKAIVETYNTASGSQVFKGASVNTFEYVEGTLSSLSANALENIAQVQWNENINIDSTSNNTTSFTEFYNDFLSEVSSNVEDNKIEKEAQDTVLSSLEKTFDNLTSVDTDEEMVNLLLFQKAYEANAKIITAVDEMLQTLLDM